MPNKLNAGDYAVIISDIFPENLGKMVRVVNPAYREKGKSFNVLVEACDKVAGLSCFSSFKSEYGDVEEYKGTCLEMPTFSDSLILIFSPSASSRHHDEAGNP